MDNHPIPQDVTGFKFKLIGSITVKQFIYLIFAGVIGAIILFLIPSKSPLIFFLVKIPITVIIAGISAGLAFVPIDGRPMDKMIMNFIKTIPSENEYMYKKQGVRIAAFDFVRPPHIQQKTQSQETPTSSHTVDKHALIRSRFQSVAYKPDETERAYMATINSYFANPSQQVIIPSTPTIKKNPLTEAVIPFKNVAEEHSRILKADLPPVQKPVIFQAPEPTPPPAQTLSPIQNLQPTPTTSSPQTEILPEETHTISQSVHVKVISHDAQLQAGFPTLPDIGNVIMGIVKDPRGRVIPNVLVEVVDPNNTPVRAFKTNKLGQFAAATPLPSGTYKIYFDDPQKKQEFDTIELTLAGEIFQPLEITSIDDRERLRRELFEKT